MKIFNLPITSFFYYCLFLLLVFSCSLYVIRLNELSLWGDELWLVHYLNSSYVDLFNPGYLNDPNFPFSIIFFKFFSDLLNISDPTKLVWINLLNLMIIIFSAYMLRKKIGFDNLIIFLSLLVSSEFFIRIFFELKSSGLILSLSTSFSVLYFLYLEEKEKGVGHLYPLLIVGSLLSLIHPFCGLLVASTYFVLFFSEKNKNRALLFLGSFIPLAVVYFYSNRAIEDLHLGLSFSHIVNTGGFIIPIVIFSLIVLISEIKFSFKHLIKESRLMFPSIISLTIIFIYSIFVIPIYQARYFMVFVPITAIYLVLVHKSSNNSHFIKILVVLVSILSVLFFYGPRSQIPYTNLQDLIVKSHTQECNNKIIFYNNVNTHNKDYFIKVFTQASKLYSNNNSRDLVSYNEFIKLYKPQSSCKIIGITGQTEETVFENKLSLQINTTVISTLADKCTKRGCGVIWTIP